MDLKGQVAILTGAAQGLGYAIAKAYVAEGMKLALMDNQADKLDAVVEELKALGGDCLSLPVDLSDADATQAAIDKALGHYGTPRVLIHNAALLRERSMREITLKDWQKEMNIIVQAGFQLCKAVWEPMIAAGGGSIMLLSSGSGVRGFVKEIAYTPGKHAIEGLMKSLALEGQEFNIAVNSVTPGAPINTPMSASNYTEEAKQRWVDPAVITEAFVFLAKQDASGVTGKRIAARVGTYEILEQTVR
ncbi:MAG: SDR family oxidoreductase [Chloroflexi bacterium]|nr:SDR family oxidoreductase [Chloroflexota bacterium]MCC6893164.1 SDR family oxidoreductase [Anaerolineae bacterium]